MTFCQPLGASNPGECHNDGVADGRITHSRACVGERPLLTGPSMPASASHPRPRSRARALLGALALLGGLLGASAAEAQEITTTAIALGDRTSLDLSDLATSNGTPIGLAECQSETLDLRFTNVDVSRTTLEFFFGDQCSDATVRQDNTTTTCQELTPSFATEMNSQITASIPISELIDCSLNSGVRTIWVLALNQPSDPVAEAGQMDSFPLAFDFVPPGAVSELTTTPGENTFRVSWTGSTENLSGYEIFFAPNGCDASGAVTTDLLTEPPDTSTYVADARGTASGAQVEYNGDLDTLPIGSQSAVAVRAVDLAGNVGPVSAAACVERVPINSWWNTYCEGPDASADACSESCAVSPGRRHSSLPGLALAGLALALLVARRRR